VIIIAFYIVCYVHNWGRMVRHFHWDPERKVPSRNKLINLFKFWYLRPGLGNVRPAGHMRPAKHLNVAREHFFQLIKHLKMPLETLLLRKWTAKNTFFLKSHNKLVIIVLILAHTYQFCFQCVLESKRVAYPFVRRSYKTFFSSFSDFRCLVWVFCNI